MTALQNNWDTIVIEFLVENKLEIALLHTHAPSVACRPYREKPHHQLYVVGHLASWASETRLVAMSLAVVTLMNLAEGAPLIIGFWGYLALLIPARTIAHNTLQACLQSMFTQRVPQGDLGAALGVLNVLSSASGVVAPAYGGKLIGYLGILARPTVNAAHFAAFFVLWWVTEVARGGAQPAEGGEGLRKPESVAADPVGEAATDAGVGDSPGEKYD